MTEGQLLKQSLGLYNFKKAYIQKAFDTSPPVYIITVDSRHDGLPITWSRIKKFRTTLLAKTTNGNMEIKQTKLTPPIELDDFTPLIPLRSLILFRDIAGEYLMKDGMYESVKVLRGTLREVGNA